MAKIKLSDYVAKRLKEHGVDLFFMVSGGGAMHLNDSLGKEIKYIANNHEQSSAFAAEGYARVNQRLAVVNITTGPGGLNCLNGVFGQWTDSVSVLYISGQVKRATMLDNCKLPTRQLGDQEVDIIQTIKHLTKYSVCIKKANEIKYHIDKAIYEATTGRKGPCWIDIPIDVQSAIIEEDELIEFTPNDNNNYDLKINDIIKELNKAKRPVIIAGHGIRLSGMINEFKTLVQKLNIPVLSTFNGFDFMLDENEFAIGRIGTIGQRAGNFVLQNADLILCLGTRNNIRQISYNWENFGKNAFKVIVDIDNAELEKPLVQGDIKICADLKEFIPELIKKVQPLNIKEWIEYCKNLKEKYSFRNYPEHKQDKEINPYYFIEKLTSKLGENDTLVSANGTPSICIFQVGHLNGERIIMNSGDASMGYGICAGLGASFETKGKTVIVEGDGSILMNIQELQTIAFNKIPVKIFIINNNGYSSIRQTQRNFFDGNMTGSGEASGVGVPKFKEVGEAFGIKSLRLEKIEDMEKVIEEVLSSDGPILCEVMTESEYNFLPKLSSRKLEDGTMISASLEDMYPFLPRDEFDENMLKVYD